MRVSRRDLLKGAGATVAVGGLSGLMIGSASAMHSVGANPVLLDKRSGTVNTTVA